MAEKRGLETTGLSESTIEALRSVFRQFPEIASVILYGSRAKGTYRNGSDIDLTITLKPGCSPTLELHHRIAQRIDDLNLIYTFDLSFYQQINNPDLVEHINRVGITLYKKPAA